MGICSPASYVTRLLSISLRSSLRATLVAMIEVEDQSDQERVPFSWGRIAEEILIGNVVHIGAHMRIRMDNKLTIICECTHCDARLVHARTTDDEIVLQRARECERFVMFHAHGGA